VSLRRSSITSRQKNGSEMTFGSLFSGIGGIDLGLERAGMTCAWQVEIDPWCRQVLTKHWPNVEQYEDVTSFCRRIYDCDPEDEEGYVNCPRCDADFAECGCIGTDQLVDTHGYVDLIAGGFPCQDVSLCGNREGLDGERSGLWEQFRRIIGELDPRYVLIENVTGILSTYANGGDSDPADRHLRTLGYVLRDLADFGYDAEWQVLSASDVGALHERKRVFIVAHSNGPGRQKQRWPKSMGPKQLSVERGSSWITGTTKSDWWGSEPNVGRVAHGVPGRVDRLAALGNAVVPQCAELIGKEIMAHADTYKSRG